MEHAIVIQALFAFLQRAFFAIGVTQAGHDDVGVAQVFLFGVPVGRRHDVQSGGLGGQHAVARIFNHDALIGFEAQFGKRQIIDFGVGFLLADDVASQHKLELNVLQDPRPPPSLPVRWRWCTPHHQPAPSASLHQPVDARSQGKFAGLDQLHEERGLALVHGLDEFVNSSSGLAWTNPWFAVMLHAFLAAGNLQQFVIIFHAPLIGEAELFEGHVEGDAVPVALGVDDDAVLVEKDCFDFCHLFLVVRPRRSVSAYFAERLASLSGLG